MFKYISFILMAGSLLADSDNKLESAAELLAVAHFINDEVHRFIHFSSNTHPEIEDPFRKTLWLDIMRADNPEYNQGLRKRLREELHLNFDDDEQEPPLKRQKVFGFSEFEGYTYGEMRNYFFDLENRKLRHKDETPITSFHDVERRAKNALLFGVGNCGEMASLAFVFLLEYPKTGLPNLPRFDRRVFITRMAVNRPGDHVYTVLRDWHGNEVILDPWMDEVFLLGSAAEKHSTWFSYVPLYGSHKTDESVLGSGHSRRWIDHRQKKGQPQHLRDWHVYKNRYSLSEKTSINEIFAEAFITRIARKRKITAVEYRTAVAVAPRFIDFPKEDVRNFVNEILDL